MKELVKISKETIGNESVNAVDARELHAFLEVKTAFHDWINKRISSYKFIKDYDYLKISDSNYKGIGQAPVFYTISLDMAKELSMVERNQKGKQARQYFIQCEKIAKGISKENLDKTSFELELIGAKYASEILRTSEVGRLQMLHTVYSSNGVATTALPIYVENTRPTFAAKVLLDKNKCGISTIAFNKLMVASGFMEEKQRPSTKTKDKIKKFKSLTAAGLQYGQNNTSPQNSRETQPHYFEDTFMELFGKLNQEAEAA